MPTNERTLSLLYQRAHDRMRDVEGLLPQEAFDELLKFLFYRDCTEETAGHPPCNENGLFREDPGMIRGTFATELAARAPWALQLWGDGQFHLSDGTLTDLQRLFAGIRLTDLPLDVRSAALRTFLSSDERRGLGVFLTPEDVVRTMVEVVKPKPNEVVLDPACGSGTFLLETVRFLSAGRSRRRALTVRGIEKNPRMLLLAGLNLGHQPGINFERACADSLRELAQPESPPLDLVPNSVDVILTNPPFGVTVTRDTGVLDLFETGTIALERKQNKVPSEVLFLELCLRLLRPGGRLGIVLPRSVITNERIAKLRHTIDQIGALTSLIDLPPETFASTGTQTTTVAAFFRKHRAKRNPKTVSVRVCHVTNVGFDTTGRHREGSQLPMAARKPADSSQPGEPTVTTFTDVPSNETLQRAAGLLFRRHGQRTGMALRQFIEEANTGRTPGRSVYTEEGVFILKVGNLTGHGIDWEPRDRNFVSQAEGAKRARSKKLDLRKGDILLTSSAHAARYIAKKVDVIAHIPDEHSGVTFVGEVLRVRPAQGVDPFILLAALRHPQVRGDLQASVRGQTAHLSPADLLEIVVPGDLRNPGQALENVADLLRQEADLAYQLSSVALKALRLLESSSTTSI